MNTTSSNKVITLNRVVIDLNSSKKVFKYQRAALAKIGFTVTIGNSLFKFYDNKEAVLNDSDNIRKAFYMMSKSHGNAEGAVITDFQFAQAKNLRFIPVSTNSQRQLFNNIVK